MERWERDMEKHNARIHSFEDTCRMCEAHEGLARSVADSVARQQIILDKMPIRGTAHTGRKGRVSVTLNKTLQAAVAYKGKHIAVLNFASPYAPGGGGVKAGITQEECLCRESTLWPCISTAECINGFYSVHEQSADKWLVNSDMIYTPGVTVFKTYDDPPAVMDESDWFAVDVITMSAPNAAWAGKRMLSDDEMIRVFKERFERVIWKASVEDVDVLILGAFGCGIFENDPVIVATGAARAMDETRCLESFEHVEFACYDTRKKKNYRMFRVILDRYLNASV